MSLARGPRPLSIRLFAAVFLALAAASFAYQITHLASMQAVFASSMAGIDFDRDRTIVVICARAVITLIPVALIWFLASRVARWLVLLLAVGRLVWLPFALAAVGPGQVMPWPWVASLLLSLAGAGLLFTRKSARWFSGGGRPAALVFE